MMPLRAAALLLALPALSGCVAAALPVLAAGGVISTRGDGDAETQERGPPRVAIDLSPASATDGTQSAGPPPAGTLVQNYTLADGTRMEVRAGPLPPPSGSVEIVAPPPASALTGIPEQRTLEDGTTVRIVAGALPPPSGAAMPPAGFRSYDPLYSHALTQGSVPVVGSERRSVLLANPAALAPDTRACSIHPAAVLIDLDPGAAVLDPEAARSAEQGLVRTLAALRAQGLTIGWISSTTADRAGAVRRALIGSGLDPVGRDELALLRYPEESKQARREDFAKQFCVVAIAGDERGDFDELFQYIKDPSVAAPLDALVGKGWFLIPQPLS